MYFELKSAHWPNTNNEIIYIFDQSSILWVISPNTKYLGKNQYIAVNFTPFTDIFV